VAVNTKNPAAPKVAPTKKTKKRPLADKPKSAGKPPVPSQVKRVAGTKKAANLSARNKKRESGITVTGKQAQPKGHSVRLTKPSSHLTLKNADLVTTTRRKLGLTQEVFSRLIGVTQRSISGWEKGSEINDVSSRRVKEMDRLAEELKKVMKQEFIPHWLVTPNDALGGISPIEAMARGENDRVWRSVFLLGSGIPI
jgi:DNA-binding transcriptional regulator YiaG